MVFMLEFETTRRTVAARWQMAEILLNPQIYWTLKREITFFKSACDLPCQRLNYCFVVVARVIARQSWNNCGCHVYCQIFPSFLYLYFFKKTNFFPAIFKYIIGEIYSCFSRILLNPIFSKRANVPIYLKVSIERGCFADSTPPKKNRRYQN